MSGQVNLPNGVAVDGSGNLYIADHQRIRKVAAETGIITTVAGNGAVGYPQPLTYARGSPIRSRHDGLF